MNNNNCQLIPHKFKLEGETIKVVVDDEYLKKYKSWGEADFNNLKVILCRRSHSGYLLTKEDRTVTFYHELVHHILDRMGMDKLNEDEIFVDGFAYLLYEYEKTKK